MRQFGLIGYPLSHSFSKKYFTDKFVTENIQDCRYDIFPIEQIEKLPALINDHPSLQGLNVTIPYKEKVIPYLDSYSEVVQLINACNCIVIRDGHLKGFNTDVIGFEHTLKQQLKPYHNDALVLGTGGAAKAVAYVLKQNGIRYLNVSRKRESADLTYEDLDNGVISNNKLIINTTPVGMYPDISVAPSLPYENVSSAHLFIDLIYNPAKTMFLQLAEQKGAMIQNGSEMLIVQAEESWKIWNDQGNL